MWHSIEQEAPTENGWVLVSTNMGIGFARYLKSFNEFRDVSVASGSYSTKLKILHWAKMPDAPAGDFDADIGGFQRKVNVGY